MKYVASLGIVFVLAVVLASAADLESWRRSDYIRCRTIQSLAPPPQSDFYGWFLTITGDGEYKMTRESGMADSSTQWQIRTVTKKRHYTAHVIMNRGDSKYNGSYLALDPETGNLILSKRETNTCYWSIRYAGKYQGWDSFYIQSLTETEGVTDMKYLVVDGATGEIYITDKRQPGMNWTIQHAPDMPAETKIF